MKRVSALLACLLTIAVAVPAQAGGHRHGGGHGVQHFGGHGNAQSHGHGIHYRGSSNHWLAPVLGAAIVGSVIYAASTPSYATPVVVQQYVPPSRVAYFCSTSQQYYPNVLTCQVPWQPVNY